jgi:hypothetical protein
MNRRMKAERGPAAAGFEPVCSSVAGMRCIISKEGVLRKPERALRRERGCDSSRRATVTGYQISGSGGQSVWVRVGLTTA